MAGQGSRLAAGLLPCVLFISACGTHPKSDAGAAYADPATCAACHAGIAKSYAQTGMGRSFYRPTLASVTPNATYDHKPSGRYYGFTTHDNRFFQTRREVGYQNKPDNLLERPIDYVVGSGNHARTYLYKGSDGQLYEMPVSWYSEKGGSLAMSPGYDNPHPEDFRRPVPDDCLFCHNGYPRGNAVAEGIDCQRCHGPGQAHVDSAGKSRLIDPVKLDRDRQMDVCMQCHLETTSLRLPNAIRRFDRPAFSFRPGERLTDYEFFFDHAPNTGYDDRFEVAHHAYRLRKSACFLKSNMTCTTCHDPHQVQTVDHFVAVCRTCHANPHSTANCLDCHMWKRRSEDAVHTVMTDHFIQRRKPARDFLAGRDETSPVYKGEVIPYYGASEVYTALAQVEHESNLEAGIPLLERVIAKEKSVAPDVYVELGEAYSKAGRPDLAIQSFQKGGNTRELAAAYAQAGDYAKTVAIGRPAGAIARTNLGNAYLHLGNADRAIELLDADTPEAQNLLGLAWLAKQNEVAAERAFRYALALQPDMAEAYENLANLLAGRHDYAQAEWCFRKAILSDPAYAGAHHSYGLLLVLTKSYDLALTEFHEAVKLDPASPRNHLDYGDALLARKRTVDAQAEYTRAVQLAREPAPEFYEACLSLGGLLKSTGRASEAQSQLQKAARSSDPEIRQSALKLLQ